MTLKRYAPYYGDSGMELDEEGRWVEFEDHLAEVNAVVDNFEEIELWYVKGIGGTYYINKDTAELACSRVFADESCEAQYARIFFRRFYREKA